MSQKIYADRRSREKLVASKRCKRFLLMSRQSKLLNDREVEEILEQAADLRPEKPGRIGGRTDGQPEGDVERVMIPLPGMGMLDLPRALFDKHLQRPPNTAPDCEPSHSTLIDADRLEELTGVPASWWAAQARERRVPFRKFGKYVRFDPQEIFSSELYKRQVVGAIDFSKVGRRR